MHVNDAAGQGWQLSREQRKLGLKADLLVFNETPFDYGYDFNLNYKESFTGKIKLNFNFPLWFKRELFDYDVFHFYSKYRRFFSSQLALFDFDIKLLKALNKKFILHFLGSDARQLDIHSKYKYSYANELGFDPKIEEAKRQRIRWYKSFADLLIVGDYELEEYVANSVVLPIAYDADTLESLKTSFSSGNSVKICHSPSNRIIKGTQVIVAAIKKLKNELKEFDIELQLVEAVSHKKALEIYAKADICVDQMRIGSYGTFAVESMALGKPVVSYIRDDLISKYTDLPIINANPDNLYQKLKATILNKDFRLKSGVKGKSYIRDRHLPQTVAAKSIELYLGINDKKTF